MNPGPTLGEIVRGQVGDCGADIIDDPVRHVLCPSSHPEGTAQASEPQRERARVVHRHPETMRRTRIAEELTLVSLPGWAPRPAVGWLGR